MPAQTTLLPETRPEMRLIPDFALNSIAMDTLASPSPGLVESVRRLGVLQPVILQARTSDQYFRVLDGRRRVTAALMNFLGVIPAVVVPVGMERHLTEALSLSSHLHRSDNPVTDLGSIERLMHDGWAAEDIATQLGCSISTINSRLRLAGLPDAFRGMLDRGELPLSTARALNRLTRENQQLLADRCQREGTPVSRRDVRAIAELERAAMPVQEELLPSVVSPSDHSPPTINDNTFIIRGTDASAGTGSSGTTLRWNDIYEAQGTPPPAPVEITGLSLSDSPTRRGGVDVSVSLSDGRQHRGSMSRHALSHIMNADPVANLTDIRYRADTDQVTMRFLIGHPILGTGLSVSLILDRGVFDNTLPNRAPPVVMQPMRISEAARSEIMDAIAGSAIADRRVRRIVTALDQLVTTVADTHEDDVSDLPPLMLASPPDGAEGWEAVMAHIMFAEAAIPAEASPAADECNAALNTVRRRAQRQWSRAQSLTPQ